MVSTGLTSAHIPDERGTRCHAHTEVSTGLTSAHIPDHRQRFHPCAGRLNGPDFGPYSGLRALEPQPWFICLNGPDFGPYSGHLLDQIDNDALRVSTGLTSAHIPDIKDGLIVLHEKVSTGLTSAHIPDGAQRGYASMPLS